MDKSTFLLSILASWIASNLLFSPLSLQHLINGFIIKTYNRLFFKRTDISGRWLSIYQMPKENLPNEKRQEIVTCNLLSGNEIRGTIKILKTSKEYIFLGKLIMDELVAHYWAKDKSRDIGCFKLKVVPDKSILYGYLILFDSTIQKDMLGIKYEFRRYPYALSKKFYSNRSEIHDAGMFTNRLFSSGKNIGKLKYGKSTKQGKYTIEVNGKHRIVKKPWRYINHSCQPNCSIKIDGKKVYIISNTEILPQDEITINYLLLNETLKNAFTCNCPICRQSKQKNKIKSSV